MTRDDYRADSNNASNPNRNLCALAVCEAFGTATSTRYLHTMGDIVRCIRTRYTVRSRRSSVRGRTVGAIRGQLARVAADAPGRVVGFVVGVPGHVLVMASDGRTLIDTSPKQRDRRRVTHLYVVYR
ncbi:MAG TPA: hypothetical protein VIY27_04365 [Myxococcota bacterium]